VLFQPGLATALFRDAVPETVLREVATSIIQACPPVVKRSRRLYPPRFLPQAIGFDRYLEIQRAVAKQRSLREAFPFLEIVEERHEGGSTYYFAIETPEVRIAVDKVNSPNALPAHRKRLKVRPSQPSLFDKGKKIYSSLLYGFGNDPAVVTFMHVRFLQENGVYLMEEGLDLLALLRSSAITVPVERVEARLDTPLRAGKTTRIGRSIRRSEIKLEPELS
jgi:hypothetical protein